MIDTTEFLSGVLSVLDFLWPILVAILIFGLIVFIHEFGHFIFAKMFGVRVNEFAIGFGPKLCSKQGKETLYSLRLFPLGGFCAMEGEDEVSDDARSFGNVSIIKRILIVFAGGFFNLILGLVLVGVTLGIFGLAGTTTVAEFTDDNAYSEQSGLQLEDEIYSINGRRTYSSSDVSYMLVAAPTEDVEMTVIRNGEKKDLHLHMQMTEQDGTNYLIMDFKVYGLRVSGMSFFQFIKYTLRDFMSQARLVWMSLFDLITGRFGLNELSGPVGLIKTVSSTVGSVSTLGLYSVTSIMALITINLGLVNLMPLPALDGGRILLLAVQGITRKKIPEKYEGLIHTVGFVLLMLLIAVISVNDIIKLFT